MKWNTEIKLPNSRAAGATAILLGFIVVAAIGLYVVKGMVDAQYAELDAKNTQIASMQRRLKMPVGTQATASGANVFLEGANYALAANSLQQHIVQMVEQSGGKIVSVSTETPAATEQTSRRVIVQVRSELDNDALQNVLYGLESGRPLALVDSINVHRMATENDSEKNDAKRSPRLTVELRVVGFYRGTKS
jgi:hypothetical protein